MARGFRMGGNQTQVSSINLLAELIAGTWTTSQTGNISGASLTFNDNIVAYVQLKAESSGNSYTWTSNTVTLSGQKKLTLTNSVVTGGNNPSGLSSYIDVICDGSIISTVNGTNSSIEINLPNSASNISIQIRSVMSGGSGSTWPYVSNTITQLDLT